jgi:hypothetical protein
MRQHCTQLLLIIVSFIKFGFLLFALYLVSLYVILLKCSCWRAMGRHGMVKMTVAHGRHDTGKRPMCRVMGHTPGP